MKVILKQCKKDCKAIWKYLSTHKNPYDDSTTNKRWAMIGRSVIDKKNFATFFLYDETPWHHDPVMEEEISRVFGN